MQPHRMLLLALGLTTVHGDDTVMVQLPAHLLRAKEALKSHRTSAKKWGRRRDSRRRGGSWNTLIKCKACCKENLDTDDSSTCWKRCKGKGDWSGAPQQWYNPTNQECVNLDAPVEPVVSVAIQNSGAFTESVVAGFFKLPNDEEETKYYITSEKGLFGPGTLHAYDSAGTKQDGFNPSVPGNTGLALDAENKQLYVAAQGSIQVFDFTDALGNTATRTINLQQLDGSSYSGGVNGLCLSSDGLWLYATEPGYEVNMDFFSIMPKTCQTAHLWAINLENDEVTPLLIDLNENSPNGCAVDPDDPELVYLANFAHGVTAFHRTIGAVSVNFGSNIKEDTVTNQRAGDGIVYYDGRLYMTSFGLTFDPMTFQLKWDGNLWSCDLEGTEDCEVFFTPTHGADIQLDTTGSEAYVLLPEFAEVPQPTGPPGGPPAGVGGGPPAGVGGGPPAGVGGGPPAGVGGGPPAGVGGGPPAGVGGPPAGVECPPGGGPPGGGPPGGGPPGGGPPGGGASGPPGGGAGPGAGAGGQPFDAGGMPGEIPVLTGGQVRRFGPLPR